MNDFLKDRIKELEFNSQEEEDSMLLCSELFLKGGIQFLGKNSFELSELTNVPVYVWSMFLKLPPVKSYVKETVNSIIESNANKAILEIMHDDVKSSDVSRMKELQKISEDLKKQNNMQTYIITRVPQK